MSRAGPPPPAAPLHAQPSDVTLVKDFLWPWVTSGDAKAGAYVHAADLYAADPEKLARRFPPAVSVDGDRAWYFLSPLRAKSPRDRRKVRAVADGAGCWHSEAGPRNVVDRLDGGERHVGYRQSFSFMRRSDGDAGKDIRTGWIMAEFHLHHCNDPGDDDRLGKKVEGLVLCKMYRSPRNNRPPAVTAPYGGGAADDVGDGVSSTETATFSCRKSKAVVDDEDLNVVTQRRQQRHCKSSDGTPTAGDNEVSGAAPCPKNKAVAADNEDLLASLPARKKMRVADAESSGVALALNATAAGAPAAAAQLHCPQCGFHLAALQALVTLTKSQSVVNRGDAGDSEIPRRQRRTPSCGILEQRTCTRFS